MKGMRRLTGRFNGRLAQEEEQTRRRIDENYAWYLRRWGYAEEDGRPVPPPPPPPLPMHRIME